MNPNVEGDQSAIIHEAPRGVNARNLFPVIVGKMIEDDEGNLEYTYYDRPVKVRNL